MVQEVEGRMYCFILLLLGFSGRLPGTMLRKSKCAFTMFYVYKVSEHTCFCKLK